MSFGLIGAIRVVDRFTLPPSLKCSEAVRSDLAEAARAFNAQAPRAAVVMARRALERTCAELGARGNRLVDKVVDLKNRGIFDDAYAAAATAVRLFGNYGAHPSDDLLDEASDRRAEQALRVVVDLLETMNSPSGG